MPGGVRVLNIKSYGKLLLSAYLMNKVKPAGSKKKKGLVRYGELALGAYLLEKLKSGKSNKEVEADIFIEPEKLEKPKQLVKSEGIKLGESREGYSMKFGKIFMGAIIGATAVYALKKHAAKKNIHKIAVE